MTSLVIPVRPTDETRADTRLGRVTLIWGLLFLNVIGTPGRSPILPIPHQFGQLITQSALPAAFVLALTVNPKVFIRPNWFLGLYSLLAVISLAMSIRFVGLGTAYRGFRLVGFLAVLWLLTPWWRDRGLVLLRSQLIVLSVLLGSLVIGFVLDPSKAFSLNYGSARLTGVIWPISATAVGHYMAELTGLVILMWACGIMRRKPALWLIGLGLVGLIASHTRTAILGLVAGLLVAGLSLFVSTRRVRRAFAITLVVIVAIVLPLSPIISSWLIRGQSTESLQTLSGRTSYWGLVLSAPRPETNKIFGSGMTRDSVMNQSPAVNGLPIDSSWIATYQNQGIVGCVLEGLMFLILVVIALLRPRGPTRALALFLIIYSLVSSLTEAGMGEASPHLIDLALAASLLVPRAPKNRYSQLQHGWPKFPRLLPALRPPRSRAACVSPPPPRPLVPVLPASKWLPQVSAPLITTSTASTAFNPPTPTDSHELSSKLRRGAFWSVSTVASLRLANFILIAVVAHILAPRSFGVFAIAVTVYSVAVNIGELGAASCVLRADLDLDTLAPTMITVATVSTALFAVAMTIFAKPLAVALGSADATEPIRVMALTVFLIGVFTVPIAQLMRDLQLDRLFLANLAGLILSTAALLLLAHYGDGAMAFAWSRVLTQVGIGFVAIAAVSKFYWPGLRREGLSILWKIGLPLAAASSVNYILLNVDYAFVGHFMGPTALGAYVIAFTVASAPAGMLSSVIGNLAVPAFSRLKDSADVLNSAIFRSLRVVSLVVFPMCILIMVLARPLVLTVYGSKWASAASALAILSLYGAISLICILFINIMTSLGRTKFILIVELIWLASLVPAMAIGVHYDGIVGAAIAHIVIIVPVVLPCYLIALKRATGIRIATLAKAILPPLLAASLAALGAKVVASQSADPLIQLATGLIAGVLIYAIAAAPQGVAMLSEGQTAKLRGFRIVQIYSSAARKVRLLISG